MGWGGDVRGGVGMLGVGNSHMKRSGMLVAKFELNPWRRLMWAWLEVYLAPKRYQLKRNGLDYQSLFLKGAHSSRPD